MKFNRAQQLRRSTFFSRNDLGYGSSTFDDDNGLAGARHFIDHREATGFERSRGNALWLTAHGQIL